MYRLPTTGQVRSCLRDTKVRKIEARLTELMGDTTTHRLGQSELRFGRYTHR